MPSYEYRVVPAPQRGEKAKGAKTTTDRFAHALTRLMNDLGRDGWEYLRADTLPCEERVGFTGRTTAFHHLLVFRRTLTEGEASRPAAAEAPGPASFTATAAEGLAPRLGAATAEPVVLPPLGPARASLSADPN